MKSTADEVPTSGRDSLDEAIERDVMELRRLTNDLPGPQEPHPAYWQNFVVRVHDRVDKQRVRDRARRFWWRWSAVGASAAAAVLVVFVGFKGVLPGSDSELQNTPPVATNMGASVRSMPTPPPLFAADANPIVLSKEDVQKYNAIVSGDDDDVFEQLAKAEQ